MKVISASEFKSNQAKYFEMANLGNEIIIKSRNKGSFKITPVDDDDTLMSREAFFEKLDKSMQEFEEGNFHSIRENETVDEFIDRLLCTE